MARSRTHLLAAAALGLAVAVVPALPAVAHDGPTVSTDGDTITIKLFEKETGGNYIPKGGEPGDFPTDKNFRPALGDAFTFTSDLLQGGTKVGTDAGTCTVVKVPDTNRCKVTMTFADATLTVDATTTFEESNDPFDVPIASGTGDYAGAKGTLTVKPEAASNGDNSFLTAVFTTGTSTTQVSEVPAGGAATGGGVPTGGAGALGLFAIAGAAMLGGTTALAKGRSLARQT